MKSLTLLALTLAAASAAPPAKTETAGLTIEKLVEIKHPSEPVWSPDARHVAFLWERGGVSNLYLADGGSREVKPVAVTSFPDGQIGAAFWSGDGKSLYFPRGGDLWTVSISGGAARAAWTTPEQETDIVISTDRTRVAFVRSSGSTGHDLFVRTLAGGNETRLVHDENGIQGVAWSPDGSHISYSAGARSIRHEEAPEYSGAKIIYTITERIPWRDICHFVHRR